MDLFRFTGLFFPRRYILCDSGIFLADSLLLSKPAIVLQNREMLNRCLFLERSLGNRFAKRPIISGSSNSIEITVQDPFLRAN